MDQRVWWSWKGAPDEDTSHPVPVDEETQLLFVQEALGWGKLVIQGSFFQTHGLLYSQVGHCIQVAMGQGSAQNILRCKIFQVDLCKPIAEPVAAALAVYDNLKKLKLCELNIDLVTVHAIFDALQSNTGLQTLVLDSVYLEDEAWTVVGRALARNRTLQHLRLRRTLSQTGLEAVCTIIINNKSLKSLDISDNRIGDEGMMHLLKALTVNRSIERVVLSSNAFGDHGAHILSKVVQQSTTLVLLDVDSNNIGKMGARELGPALAANSTLQVLRLSRNFLDDASVKSIAAAAGKHKKLEQLDLSFNRMGPEGVQALAQYIISPSRAVDSLLLHGNCMIGNDGALHLAKVLPRARKLTRLDLSDCEIGDKGALALAKGLARNKSLLDFRIAHNQITHEGAAAFASALRSNKTLKYFDFSFNWVGHRGIAPLKEVQAQVAERCHMVWELSLEYCQIEKFKYGDYTMQPDDTSTQQDQQDNPASPGENPWSPRSGEPSENDTHVTSTLTAISENRLDTDSLRPPLSTRSLSVADGAYGPQAATLSSSQVGHQHTVSRRPDSNGNEIQIAPLPSLPSGPDRADSFESVSLGAVPPSPMFDDAEGSTPGKSEPRVPFQQMPSGLRRETHEDFTISPVHPNNTVNPNNLVNPNDAVNPNEESVNLKDGVPVEGIQENGHGLENGEDVSITGAPVAVPTFVRTVSTTKRAAEQGLPSPHTAELALVTTPHTYEHPTSTSAPDADAAADADAAPDADSAAAHDPSTTAAHAHSATSEAEASLQPTAGTEAEVRDERASIPIEEAATSSTGKETEGSTENDLVNAPGDVPSMSSADDSTLPPSTSNQLEEASLSSAAPPPGVHAESEAAPAGLAESAEEVSTTNGPLQQVPLTAARESEPVQADLAESAQELTQTDLPLQELPLTDVPLQEVPLTATNEIQTTEAARQLPTADPTDAIAILNAESAVVASTTEDLTVATSSSTVAQDTPGGTVGTTNPSGEVLANGREQSNGTTSSSSDTAAAPNGDVDRPGDDTHTPADSAAVEEAVPFKEAVEEAVPYKEAVEEAAPFKKPGDEVEATADVADLLGHLGSSAPATEIPAGALSVGKEATETDDAAVDLMGLDDVDLGSSSPVTGPVTDHDNLLL